MFILVWWKECDIYEFLLVGYLNIIKLRILWEICDSDLLWFIMEYCENGFFRKYLEKKVFSWSEVVVLVSGIISVIVFFYLESF